MQQWRRILVQELVVMYRSYMTCVEQFREGRESASDGTRRERSGKGEPRKAGGGGTQVPLMKRAGKKAADTREEQAFSLTLLISNIQ